MTVKYIRKYGEDDYLGNHHTLLLMDDTVIFATTRAAMKQKLSLLVEAINVLQMEVHPSKSKYMTVNATDTIPFIRDNFKITHTNEYTYLGATISANSVTKHIALHVTDKMPHVWKFFSFLRKNQDSPFWVKKQVWESCVTSALLYSCESWMTSNLNSITGVYMSTIKELLGVRIQTPNDLSLVEAGIPPLETKIKSRQRNFLKKLQSCPDFHKRPVNYAIQLAVTAKSSMGIYLSDLQDCPVAYSDPLYGIKQKILNSSSTRNMQYRTINPELKVHDMYTRDPVIQEYQRIATTRLGLSSHRHRIETGRWSRVAREDRLCQCETGIQDEQHVLLSCPLTETLRSRVPHMFLESLSGLMTLNSPIDVVKYCWEVLRKYNTDHVHQ